MNRKYYILVGLVIVAGVMISFSTLNQSQKGTFPAEDNIVLANLENKELVWFSVNEGIEQQAKHGKKLFIDVYTNWCGPCKWLDKNTFSHPVIQEKLAAYFIPVKFNAEGNDTIRFNGEVFVNQNPGAAPRMSTHDFTPYIASTARGISYPTMVFLNEKLEMIQPLTGALAPRQLEPILEFIGADHYLTTPWEDFLATYTYQIQE